MSEVIGHKLVGNGPEKVLVLHGWFGDCSAFDPILPFVDTETFTYVFMDYRGYGASKHIAGQHTIEEIGTDALNLAKHLNWEQFHVIGHSMGGMAVQWLAARAKDLVASVIGLTPVPASGFPFDADTDALFSGAKDNPQNRNAILMHTTGNRLTPSFGKVMTDRSLAQTTPEAFGHYLTAWSKTNFASDVQGLEVPFKIIVGAHDPAVTVSVMRETIMKWFPNAELEEMENAGHYPMIETPVALVTACEAFMKRFPVSSNARAGQALAGRSS